MNANEGTDPTQIHGLGALGLSGSLDLGASDSVKIHDAVTRPAI